MTRSRWVAAIEPLERRTLLTADFSFVAASGAAGKDKATDAAVDASGTVYTVGVYNGPADFDPSASRSFILPGTGDDNGFVAKYSATGALVWAVAFSGSGAQECQSVAIDPSGNVLVTGWFSSTVDFDPSPTATAKLTSKGAEDAFVVKLTSAGQWLWTARLGGAGHEGGISIATDAAGNVYSQGMYAAAGDYDPGAGTATLSCAGQYDIYLSKLDPAGRFVYAKRFGGSGSETANGVTVDGGGNIVSIGSFTGTVDFDPGSAVNTRTAAGSTDVFLSKLSSSGGYVWCGRLGGSGAELGGDVKTDSAGNVYATGSFSGSADFDPGGSSSYNLTSAAGTADVFIAHLTAAGNFSWARRIGGGGTDKGNDLAVDASGVYLTGKFAGAVDFNPSSTAAYTLGSYNGTQDIFAAKLTTGGSFLWARRFGGSSNSDEGEGIAVSAGNLYLAGGFGNTVDFDPGAPVQSRSSAGSLDAFLLELINV